MFIAVVILCAVVAFMLFLFLAYHLWLVKTGYSTNESSKASQLGYFLERQVGFYEKWEEFKKKESDFKPH